MKSTDEKILDTLKEMEKSLKNIEKIINKNYKSNYIKETVKAGEPIQVRKYFTEGNHQDEQAQSGQDLE